MRGEKILQFCIKTTKFRDSMCHLASSLDSLPKMLGFSGDWKKVFFPLKFNVPDNQKYVGQLPDHSFYEPEEMKENESKNLRIGIFKNKSIIKIQFGIFNKICINIVKLM